MSLIDGCLEPTPLHSLGLYLKQLAADYHVAVLVGDAMFGARHCLTLSGPAGGKSNRGRLGTWQSQGCAWAAMEFRSACSIMA